MTDIDPRSFSSDFQGMEHFDFCDLRVKHKWSTARMQEKEWQNAKDIYVKYRVGKNVKGEEVIPKSWKALRDKCLDVENKMRQALIKADNDFNSESHFARLH